MTEQTGTIYGLCDPITGSLRYIGQTTQTLALRLNDHRKRRKNICRCWSWVQSVLAKGTNPTIVPLWTEVPLSELSDTERFAIASVRAAGAKLLNMTDGGESPPTIIPSVAAQIAEKLRGRCRPAEVREKLRIANLGKKNSLESRMRQSEKQRGRKLSEAHKKALSAAKMGKPNLLARKPRTPEQRARLAAHLLRVRFRRPSQSGVSGIHPDGRGKWRVRFKHGVTMVDLGRWATLEAAKESLERWRSSPGEKHV